jgi:hypothetical protein
VIGHKYNLPQIIENLPIGNSLSPELWKPLLSVQSGFCKPLFTFLKSKLFEMS